MTSVLLVYRLILGGLRLTLTVAGSPVMLYDRPPAEPFALAYLWHFAQPVVISTTSKGLVVQQWYRDGLPGVSQTLASRFRLPMSDLMDLRIYLANPDLTMGMRA